jgi:hypothetical protein
MTNRELLLMLDGDLGERAVRNCMEFGGGELDAQWVHNYLNKHSNSRISSVLFGAFAFDDSPEGYSFWRKIYDELIKIGL